MTLPRDILTGKMPAVYDTILSLGGVLIPMQSDMDGNILAYFPDGSTLTGTPGASIDFTHAGQIPRVAGGSPSADFPGAIGTDYINFGTIPLGHKLQLSGGGFTIVCLGTFLASASAQRLVVNKGNGFPADNGYGMRFIADTSIRLDAHNTASASGVGAVIPGERHVYAASTDTINPSKFYRSGTEIASGSQVLDTPINFAAPLKIGQYAFADTQADRTFLGGMDLIGLFPYQVPTEKLDLLTAQSGPLG
jgi:hypothetical protein